MIKLAELLEEKMTAAQKKKRGEIYDALTDSGMASDKAGRIATSKAMKLEKKGKDQDGDGDIDSDDWKISKDIAIKQAIAKKKLKKEGHPVLGQPSMDHEAKMAKGELRDMIENGAKIYKMIEDHTELPAWISAYITLSSDYMHSVAEYMTEFYAGGAEQCEVCGGSHSTEEHD